MKKMYALCVLTFLLLSACSGSDTYQGKWKAIDADGEKLEIEFKPKEISIKDSKGKRTKHFYTQNSVNIQNGIETYGIKLEDGRGYQIHFPLKDETAGLIIGDNGMIMFTISRTQYLSDKDLYKMN